jgi:hypothetical protein
MLHIVTHCYAIELPQYAAFLRYQLSSLVLYPPQHETWITVCCMEEDRGVVLVLDDFLSDRQINLQALYLTRDQISRRSIGRNMIAKASEAELIWFADCDYAFGEGCIDGLMGAWEGIFDWAPMIFPTRYWIHRDHETGDKSAAQIASRVLWDVDSEEFVEAKFSRPIGGVQICPGSFCRKFGYLDGHHRYQRPLDRPFSNFHDDVAFRKLCASHGPIRSINFPSLYRLRHTRTTYKSDQ